MLQTYYLNEIERGKSGVGNYTLLPEFKDMMTYIGKLSTKVACQPSDIVRSIKEKQYIYPSEPSPVSDNSRIIRAQEIRQKEGISLSSKLGIFTVFDDRNFNTVKLFPAECSCPIKKGCVHILAVKLSLNMPLQEDDSGGITNLTTVRKNARVPSKRVKPGRKKPRVGDEDPPENTEQLHRPKQDENPEQPRLEQDDENPEQQKENNPEPDENTEHHPEHDENPEHHMEHDENPEQHQPEQEENTEHRHHTEQCIDVDDMNESLERDIDYSKEVWVPADKRVIFENLNVSDRELILDPCGWLNGTLIDTAMDIIHFQFPQLAGLQSSALAVELNFRKHHDPFIQIINRSPEYGGSHWLTITNINCEPGEINICDSAFDDLPTMETMAICSLIDPPGMQVTVNILDVMQQNNSYDCGMYAIANMVTLAFGRDVTAQRYDRRKLRFHLFNCLERKEFTPFPILANKRKPKSPIKRVHPVNLYCTCKLPDTHTLYVICDGCEKEYHPVCLGLDDTEAEKRKKIYCTGCQSTKSKKQK